MANTNAPFGFQPLRSLSSGPEAGAVRRYKKEASVILAKGDPVVITGSSETATAIPIVTRAVGSEGTPGTITGVVVGFDPIRSDLSKNCMAAADTGYVFVCDDPQMLYAVQMDGAFAVADVGNGSDMTVANANTVVGKSQVVLSTAQLGQAQFQIMEMLQAEDNERGTYARVVVRINEHTYAAAGTLI